MVLAFTTAQQHFSPHHSHVKVPRSSRWKIRPCLTCGRASSLTHCGKFAVRCGVVININFIRVVLIRAPNETRFKVERPFCPCQKIQLLTYNRMRASAHEYQHASSLLRLFLEPRDTTVFATCFPRTNGNHETRGEEGGKTPSERRRGG